MFLRRARIMPRHIHLDASPPIHREMKDNINREAFRKSIPVLAVRVPPAKTASVLKAQPMKRFSLFYPLTQPT